MRKHNRQATLDRPRDIDLQCTKKAQLKPKLCHHVMRYDEPRQGLLTARSYPSNAGTSDKPTHQLRPHSAATSAVRG